MDTIIILCLLEGAFIWGSTFNRQKYARRFFLYGVGFLFLVLMGYAMDSYLYYENIFQNGFVGPAILLTLLGMMLAFAGLVGLLLQENWGRWLVGVCTAALAVFVCWVLYINSPVTHIALSGNRSCTMQFHQLFPGSGVLAYYEDGQCRGRVKLASGLFEHPWAVFPGLEDQSVVCLSLLDTTYAAFTVNFAKHLGEGAPIPVRLQEAVDSSEFEVRACTRPEVNYVANLIRTAEIDQLDNYWGGCFGPPETRKNMATFLLYATTANSWRDPVLRNAKPQLVPEGELQDSH